VRRAAWKRHIRGCSMIHCASQGPIGRCSGRERGREDVNRWPWTDGRRSRISQAGTESGIAHRGRPETPSSLRDAAARQRTPTNTISTCPSLLLPQNDPPSSPPSRLQNLASGSECFCSIVQRVPAPKPSAARPVGLWLSVLAGKCTARFHWSISRPPLFCTLPARLWRTVARWSAD
jgi:hypothetical protein